MNTRNRPNTRSQRHETLKKIERPAPRIKLMDLPDNVIELIIIELRAIVRADAYTIKETRWRYVTTELMNQPPEPGLQYVANYDPPTPILSSVQALSVVNQRLYKLCRSALWGHLEFPTSMPSNLINWTHNLMPKYGEFVRSIAIDASPDWKIPPPSSDRYKLDNMIIFSDVQYNTKTGRPIHDRSSSSSKIKYWEKHRHGISPEHATRLLVHCLHLRELNIVFPSKRFEDLRPEMRVQNDRLCLFASKLTELRSLTIQSFAGVTRSCVIDIIQHLPLLETLIISYIWESDSQVAHSLGLALSKLKNLRTLLIMGVEPVPRSWLDLHWSNNLTSLVLPFDYQIPLPELGQLIKTLAPNLEYLALEFEKKDSATTPATNHLTAIPQSYFDLPKLTYLDVLSRPERDILGAFRRCQQIGKIKYRDLPAKEWPTLANLICTSAWSQLAAIEVHCLEGHDAADWEIVIAQEKLRKFCKVNDIDLWVDCPGYIN